MSLPPEQPAATGPQLDAAIVRLIQEGGAISPSKAAQTCGVSVDDARESIRRLLAARRITWIPGLPGQGVFFTMPENSKQFALPLMMRTRGRAPWKKSSHKAADDRRQIAYDLIKVKPRTMAQIAETMNVSKATASRYVNLLRDEGAISSRPKPSPGRRGRRELIWFVPKQVLVVDRDTVRVDLSNAQPPREDEGDGP